MESRIVAVLVAYEAMTNDRAYRKALTQAEVVIELQEGAGKQFAPEIVQEFLSLL